MPKHIAKSRRGPGRPRGSTAGKAVLAAAREDRNIITLPDLGPAVATMVERELVREEIRRNSSEANSCYPTERIELEKPSPRDTAPSRFAQLEKELDDLRCQANEVRGFTSALADKLVGTLPEPAEAGGASKPTPSCYIDTLLEVVRATRGALSNSFDNAVRISREL
jgi:hypothetical protein